MTRRIILTLAVALVEMTGCRAPVDAGRPSTRPDVSTHRSVTTRATTTPVTADMRANDAALRDAVLNELLSSPRLRGLDFYGTPGATEVALFGDAVGAKLPPGWTTVESARGDDDRMDRPRLLGVRMELSQYVLEDGVTRVVGVNIFNAGGKSLGQGRGFTHYSYDAQPNGDGWRVQFDLAISG